MMFRLCPLVLAGLLAALAPVLSQETVQDTARAEAGQEVTLGPGNEARAEMTKSPATAMLFSAILPGAGQVYNESYWKVPVILGLGVYLTIEFVRYNRLTRDYRERAVQDPTDLLALRFRDFYKAERDTYVWYFFLLYLVNVADAYVDAALFDFNVGDDLSIRLLPATGPGTCLAGVSLRF